MTSKERLHKGTENKLLNSFISQIKTKIIYVANRTWNHIIFMYFQTLWTLYIYPEIFEKSKHIIHLKCLFSWTLFCIWDFNINMLIILVIDQNSEFVIPWHQYVHHKDHSYALCIRQSRNLHVHDFIWFNTQLAEILQSKLWDWVA